MNNFSTQKKLSLIMIVLCACVMLAGVILIANPDPSHASSDLYGGVSRANTGIEFGADFYTKSAQYTALAANAVVDLYSMVRVCFGLLFLFGGAIVMCKELKVFFAYDEAVTSQAKVEITPPPVKEETPAEVSAATENTVQVVHPYQSDK